MKHEIAQFLKTPQKIKEGHREAIKEDIYTWYRAATGILGWSGQARLMVDLKVDRHLTGIRTKKRRIRIKVLKKKLRETALRAVLSHLEGFDDNGYRLQG